MILKQFFCAGLFGLALTTFVPEAGFAQNLKITNQSTARKLNVSINSAVVVESDVPFAELSVANPAIADIATLSDRTIYVLGKAPGRTMAQAQSSLAGLAVALVDRHSDAYGATGFRWRLESDRRLPQGLPLLFQPG